MFQLKPKFIPNSLRKPRDATFLRAIGFSLLVHSALLILLFSFIKSGHPNGGMSPVPHPTHRSQNPVPDMLDVSIIPRPEPQALASNEERAADGTIYRVHRLRQDPGCAHWYGGIGIDLAYLNELGLLITEAIVGYPGYEGGLRTGDRIVSVDSEGGDIRGDPGTRVRLGVVKVDGTEVTLEFVRDKICISSPLGPIPAMPAK